MAKISNEELWEIIKNCSIEERKPYIEELYFNLLWLMKKVIKPYLHLAEEDELLDECFFGLHEAVEHYQPGTASFSSYACFWFKQSVIRFLENSGFVVRIPVHFRDKIRRYKKAISDLTNILIREPTDWEVAEFMGMEFSELQEIKLYSQNIISLDAPIDDEEGKETSLSDTVASEFNLENSVVEEVYTEHEKTALWGICERYLTASEYGVVEDYYKNNKSQPQIAKEMGISHQGVRQIHQKALRRMRYGQAKRELLEKLEVADAGQYRCGLSNFREHLESKTEYLAVKHIEAENEKKKQYA